MKRETLQAYLLVLPAFLIYAAFFLWPTVSLVQLSLFEWDGLNERTLIWFENYRELIGDKYFLLAFQHNFLWMVGAVIVPVVIGLFIAILLARTSLFGRTFFRTIFFIPQVLSSVTVAVIWGWIYNPTYGALNSMLEWLGLAALKQGWLAHKMLALPALFIAWSWVHYGFCMVIFIAAIDGIDEMYFDAAKVDGANWWQQFVHVLLPFIRGPLTTIVLVTAIGAFQVLDVVFVLTKGGPAYATLVIPMYMLLNAFNFSKVGYGAAIAVTLAVLVLAFSIVFLRVRKTFSEDL